MLDSGLTDVVYSNHEAVKPNRTPSQAEPETPEGSPDSGQIKEVDTMLTVYLICSGLTAAYISTMFIVFRQR